MSPARATPLEIIGPAGTAALLQRLSVAYGEWVTNPGFPLSVREVTSELAIELPGAVRLSCLQVPHTAESVAYSMERGPRRIVYTGDTGVSDALAAWARDCSLLVCECSLQNPRAFAHTSPRSSAAIWPRRRRRSIWR